MAEVNYIVDPDNGAGATHTSLAAALSDSADSDDDLIVECRSSDGTVDYFTSNISTSTWKSVYIFAPSAHRHTGKWVDGKYTLRSTYSGFTLSVPTTIRGLQCLHEATGNSRSFLGTSLSEIEIDQCIFKGNYGGTISGCRAMYIYNVGYEPRITNNIYQGFSGGGGSHVGLYVRISLSSEVYNNTFVDCNTGIYSNNSSPVYNCLAQCDDVAGTCFDGVGGDYNLSDDATASGDNSIIDATVTFAGAGDYHLASNDSSGAINGGIGPTEDVDVPTYDIDGDTRSGSTCDVGADELVSVSVAITQYQYNDNLVSVNYMV